MNEERRRILDMVAAGTVTAAEAEKLLDALGNSTGSDMLPVAKPMPKYLHVTVDSDDDGNGERERVRVKVPLKLVRAGMKLGGLLPNHVAEKLREKGIDTEALSYSNADIEELIEALGELEVEADEGKKKIRVFVE